MTLVSVPADRSATPSAIAADVKAMSPTSVSPDGESVIGIPSVSATAANEISVVSLSGRSSAARPFLTSRFRKGGTVFSPNGRWVAYSSNDSGRAEIYVSAYPGPGGTTLISDQGGLLPRWSRDRRQLFYRNGPKMMAVDVQLVPTFHAGRPEALFEAGAGTSSGFDVAPDGKRFLMIKNVGSAVASQPDQLNVVVNWIDELKTRVPVK
jgi:eukaryotic-like serine/threonine-protein kinase